MKKLALLLAALGAFTCGATAPAGAAVVSKHFKIRSGTEKTPGQGRAVGTISYLAPNKFEISGRVDDVCPADGMGAYVKVGVFLKGGARTVYTVGADARECDATGAVAFSATHSFTNKIVKLQLGIQEEDHNRPNGLTGFGDVNSWYFWPSGRIKKV